VNPITVAAAKIVAVTSSKISLLLELAAHPWHLDGHSARVPAPALAHVEAASWRPVIDSVYSLAEINAAAARLNAPERFGKVIVQIAA
jgi:hypothetical protein